MIKAAIKTKEKALTKTLKTNEQKKASYLCHLQKPTITCDHTISCSAIKLRGRFSKAAIAQGLAGHRSAGGEHHLWFFPPSLNKLSLPQSMSFLIFALPESPPHPLGKGVGEAFLPARLNSPHTYINSFHTNKELINFSLSIDITVF